MIYKILILLASIFFISIIYKRDKETEQKIFGADIAEKSIMLPKWVCTFLRLKTCYTRISIFVLRICMLLYYFTLPLYVVFNLAVWQVIHINEKYITIILITIFVGMIINCLGVLSVEIVIWINNRINKVKIFHTISLKQFIIVPNAICILLFTTAMTVFRCKIIEILLVNLGVCAILSFFIIMMYFGVTIKLHSDKLQSSLGIVKYDRITSIAVKKDRFDQAFKRKGIVLMLDGEYEYSITPHEFDSCLDELYKRCLHLDRNDLKIDK